MALLIKKYTTEYGQELSNVYCALTRCDYDILSKQVLISIHPFYSEDSKRNGFAPLPIGALDLGGIVPNVEHSDDIMAKAYEWIKTQIALATEPDAESKAMGWSDEEGVHEPIPEYETALKWRAYKDSEDC